MATVASVALTQPSSDPNINESQTFTMGGQVTSANHGGLSYDMHFQWDQGTASWQDIPSSGAALTVSTANPITGITGANEYTITVTGNTAGSYNVRVQTVDNNDGFATDTSATQAVTVNSAPKTASGAMQAGDATLNGLAEVAHAASGTLQADAAVLSGSASTSGSIQASGALQSDPATLNGAALVTHPASGAMQAGDAQLSGLAELVHPASGALQAADATLSGAASVSAPPKTAAGTLQADPSTLTGLATGPAQPVPESLLRDVVEPVYQDVYQEIVRP